MDFNVRFEEDAASQSLPIKDNINYKDDFNDYVPSIIKVDLVNSYIDDRGIKCFVLKWESEIDYGYLTFSRDAFGVLEVTSTNSINKSLIQEVFNVFVNQLNIL